MSDGMGSGRDLAADGFMNSLTPIAICRLSDGSILLGNDSCLRTIGRSAATAGHLWSPAGVVAVRDRLAESGAIDEIQIDVEHPEHGVRRLMATVGPLDVEGEACAVVAFLDTTERRQYQRVLRESQERFRQIAESLDEVFILWTLDPVEWLYVSPSADEMFGFSPEQRSLDGLRLMIHPEDRAVLAQSLAESALSGPVVLDFRITRGDGELRWIRSRTAPVTSTSPDAVPRHSSTLTDVTNEKAIEAALREARAEADRANHAKNEFLSRMSHELRTPLNAILGFGELLRFDDLDVLQRDNVDHIVEAGRHLLDLIDEVLDITRIESGLLRLSLEPVALNDLIRETTRLVGPVAETAAIRLTADAVDPAVHVRADRLRLRQVLLNLVSNGIKYNVSGGRVTISIDLTDRGTARITVADTGHGISADSMSRLFQPFERLGAESSAVQGTGLGLALARQLMTLMGGVIGADSEPGTGSRFWIELACDEPPGALTASGMARGASASAPADVETSRKVVVLVEDNTSNVRLVEQIMRRRPHVELVVAMTGAEAIAAMAAHTADLVLLDLHLPDTSGLALLTRFTTDPRTAAIPIVIVSADATEAQQRVALEMGAADYLTKPIDVVRFLRVVDRY